MMFPGLTIRKPIDVNMEVVRKQYKSSFEGGYQSVRKKYSRKTYKISLSWSSGVCLSQDEIDDLLDFFDTYQGTNWTFTHPWTLTEYTVFFSEDTLKWDTVVPGQYYSCSIMLETV